MASLVLDEKCLVFGLQKMAFEREKREQANIRD